MNLFSKNLCHKVSNLRLKQRSVNFPTKSFLLLRELLVKLRDSWPLKKLTLKKEI